MYDPSYPNNYRTVKITRWKRSRDEEQKNDMARSLAAAGSLSSIFEQCDPAPLSDEGSSNNSSVETVPLHLSAEELHRLRVRQSAAMGISTAVQMERDELEATRKAKVAAGMDRRGRIGQKLGELMEVAAAKGSNSTSQVKGSGSDVPLPVTSAPLVFQRSELAAGGYVVREDTGSLKRKRPLQGKPSSTILIRFVRDGPSVDVFASEAPGHVTARMTFLENIQEQCGRFGVVRSVRYAILGEEELSKLLSGENDDVKSKWTRESIRILVRFDTVANAFKAIEELQQQFSHWCICFFSTQLFDAGNLGPTDGEPLCASC